MRALNSEFGFQDFIDGGRVGLAACRLHHLTDEPSEHRRFRLSLRDLVGIGGNDVVDGLFDGTRIGHLLHAALLDDRGRVAALGPDDLE